MILAEKIKNSTVMYSQNKEYIIDENNQVVEVFKEDVTTNVEQVKDNSNVVAEKKEEVEKEETVPNEKENVTNNEPSSDKKEENEESTQKPNDKKENDEIDNPINNVTEKKPQTSDKMTMCLLGEIMMGGEVSNNVSYMYASAFKQIYSEINKADFTYANLTTNITNLDTIENPKSKYIVTKNILSSLKVLGLDSVSIASDHITDFPSDIIKNTVELLENENIFVAGREDTPVYFQKGDKRVAVVSTNSVINGTASLYKKEGISIYSRENLEKNIKEAKEAADIVIVDVHWGNEYQFGVTPKMKEIATLAVDSGADLVIGSHALGNYPLTVYKGIPIIYSIGYFMSDSDLYLGKDSFIYDVEISKENKIEEIVMKPIYINDKKEVLFYNNYNKEKSDDILEQYNKWNNENGLSSAIQNNTITVKFN